ncbi:MAG: NAD(P)H-dependent oxidoreductase subunit E [Ichthyobacteriaceae bacterium]|nr:NAD(P)H-dependent oxidoreductase subunit E [Ichthyobacteriaceae bacterium]
MAIVCEKDQLQEQHLLKIKEICNTFNKDHSELINILHGCQGYFGYLPAEVQEAIALEIDMPVSKVFGVVTFYSFFTMKPKGEFPISVCTGTACYVRGADKLVDEFQRELGIDVGQTTEDGKFSISTLRCVGACGLAPVVMVGDKTYGHVSPKMVKKILKEYKTK